VNSVEFILTLLSIPRLGLITARKLLPQSDQIPDDLNAFSDWLLSMDLNKITTSHDIIIHANTKANSLIQASNMQGITLISCLDEVYPKRLFNLDDYPLLLHCKGNLSLLGSPKTVAVIGTRQPSDYGNKVAVRMGELLSSKGWIVISGLAKGCDTGAHNGAIRNRNSTIAVLAHGLDRVYPSENRHLADSIIAQGGCLVTEYSIGYQPNRGSFVTRDRIQAAISKGIIVIETDIQGGTMHTVRIAKELGRPIACMQYDRQVKDAKLAGNEMLIGKQEAKALMNSEDIDSFIRELED